MCGMKKIISFFILFSSNISCNSPTANKITVNSYELEMITVSFQNALYGIRAAEEAITRSTSIKTKMLAEHILTKNVRIKSEFEELSGKKRFELPLDITDSQISNWRSLVTKKGWEFDKAFLNEAAKVDSNCVSTLKKLDREAVDKDVKKTSKSLLKLDVNSREIIAEARKNLELEWNDNITDTIIPALSVNK